MAETDPLNEHLIKRNDEVRANIREMAKWLIAGLGAIVTFAVGGSALTQLTSLEGVRFWVAAGFLVVALASCIPPLLQAIDLMAMRTYSRSEVYGHPDFAKAREKVEQSLLNDNIYEPYMTFSGLTEEFQSEVDDVKQQIDAGRTPAYANYNVVAFKVREALEFAVTQHHRDRFDRLLASLKLTLPTFAALITVFIIEANPPKSEAKEAVTPFIQKIEWRAEDEAVLKSAGLGDSCMGQAHPTLYVMTGGLRPDVLAIPPDLKGGACKIVRVTLDSDRHLALP
ncbi:hypothetical protein [Rhizobium leguminosarum]|uniref:hypothetical protein n=1 Tax=Rhizobium leguminosarum TaxID=384 RepID=UPI001C98C74C|nr:hypothetical protein [Rhizobium leguminosarum]MBY5426990.1 hypothetical protein [Rhizobium leguminosarum]